MLDQQTQLVSEQTRLFINLLLEEQAALTASEMDVVILLTEKKLAQADALEKATTPELLQGLKELRTRINQGENLDHHPLLSLNRLLEEANRLNHINGVMIEQHMKHIRLAMSHLDGITPTVRILYGKDGMGERGSIGRSLGSA
jgi:flagellar biosynthesis/type III secretory pathway chaperone